jgi:hypothetical protein
MNNELLHGGVRVYAIHVDVGAAQPATPALPVDRLYSMFVPLDLPDSKNERIGIKCEDGNNKGESQNGEQKKRREREEPPKPPKPSQ